MRSTSPTEEPRGDPRSERAGVRRAGEEHLGCKNFAHLDAQLGIKIFRADLTSVLLTCYDHTSANQGALMYRAAVITKQDTLAYLAEVGTTNLVGYLDRDKAAVFSTEVEALLVAEKVALDLGLTPARGRNYSATEV